MNSLFQCCMLLIIFVVIVGVVKVAQQQQRKPIQTLTCTRGSMILYVYIELCK